MYETKHSLYSRTPRCVDVLGRPKFFSKIDVRKSIKSCRTGRVTSILATFVCKIIGNVASIDVTRPVLGGRRSRPDIPGHRPVLERPVL